MFSVVITTFNRANTLERAVASVLGQEGATFELIVVDDGSTDETVDVLAAITDSRLALVRRPNGGLSAARNTGLERASGDFVVYLDDDDVALPGWLSNFANLIDEAVGIVFSGAEYRRPNGMVDKVVRPRRMSLCDDQIGLVMAGTWAARASLLREVGGFDERLTSSHQGELMMRLVRAALQAGFTTRHNDQALVALERRAVGDRPMSSATALYNGVGILLEKHKDRFDRDPAGRANFNAIYGVSAARVGQWGAARSALLTSALAQPFHPQRWLRLVAAWITPVGRRVWGIPKSQPKESMSKPSNLYLPDGYRTNAPASADRDGTPFWDGGLGRNDVRYQVPVYRLAAHRARKLSTPTILDIGCGSGDKLAEFFPPGRLHPVGVDQASAIELAARRFPAIEWITADLESDESWSDLAGYQPDLTICADVIEHVPDPRKLLGQLHTLIGRGLLVLSTPDRSRLEGDPFGPPGNPRHIREWTAAELAALVRSVGFEVVAHHHVLPRRYSPTVLELKRTVHRALHRRAIPDRRSCQVLELRRA